MFFNNSDNDPYGDLRRREEYQRQKDAAFARSVGSILYLYFAYSLIWFLSSALISMIFNIVFDINMGITTVIGMILSFLVFKIAYVKAHPVKSLITIGFIFGLVFVAAS